MTAQQSRLHMPQPRSLLLSLRLAVLITCHNRRETTLSCLAALFAQEGLPKGVAPEVFLVDDGSTDGTAVTVSQRYPGIHILKGDGTLFWTRAMHMAFEKALRVEFSHYLWLNDDTLLFPNALQLLFSALDGERPNGCISVGATREREFDCLTYGGARRTSRRLRPFQSVMIEPGSTPQEIDVMHGNVVLIPDTVARLVGNLDPIFEHSMGDTDYSMRAQNKGVRIILTAGFVGTCSRNSIRGTYLDKTLPWKHRRRLLFSRKGLPWRSWLVMCKRHGDFLWPLHFLWIYVRFFLGRL